MKKKYISPSMGEMTLDSMQLLSGSVQGSNGIGYGGVDDGSHDPSSRRYQYDWDDEEEDEE